MLLQLADDRQAVHSIAGETTDGLGDDQVDLPGQGIRDHLLEALALLRIRTADALVGVQTHKVPVFPATDEPGIIIDLRVITEQLVFIVSRDAGITGDLTPDRRSERCCSEPLQSRWNDE